MKKRRKILICVCITILLGYVTLLVLDNHLDKRYAQNKINIEQIEVSKVFYIERSEILFGSDISSLTEVAYTISPKNEAILDSVLLKKGYTAIPDSSFHFSLKNRYITKKIHNGFAKWEAMNPKGESTMLIIDKADKRVLIKYISI